MRHLLVTITALFALGGAVRAQDWVPEYQREFQKGIDALTAGRHDEGIAAFQRCLELNPRDSTCAYNIACGRSLEGEVDEAFVWLERSAEWGFGNTEGNIEHARKDADLAKVRSDPRFEKYIARMEEIARKAKEFAAAPAVHLPASLEEGMKVPLLIVLHDAGQTKDDVVAGPWKEVADGLGMALLAPSGKYPTGGEPSEGMAWFDDPNGYLARYWLYEKPVQDAVSAFKKEHDVDLGRVWIAGEGQGGVVAFNIAVAGPGLYKGVLVVDAPVIDQLAAPKAANAGRMGLRAAFLLHRDDPGLPQGDELGKLADVLSARTKEWGIASKIEVAEGEGEGDLVARLTKALGQLAPAAKPVEAGGDR